MTSFSISFILVFIYLVEADLSNVDTEMQIALLDHLVDARIKRVKEELKGELRAEFEAEVGEKMEAGINRIMDDSVANLQSLDLRRTLMETLRGLPQVMILGKTTSCSFITTRPWWCCRRMDG